ncbi:hypothetical protein [Brevundimonas nasdae]|uniref:hypothetical protein n=1 Tax=Brevundimonas nasdae TaxID=172043 RepID=UPI0028A0693F|nr:hypothetical protein [Brevundimonas nasdae]
MKLKVLALALAIACSTSSCLRSAAPDPALSGVYVVGTFFDAGSKVQNGEIGPTIVSLDGAMIYIASSDEIIAGTLQHEPKGWTMETPSPLCIVHCAAGKQRLQEMLRDGAIITIKDGELFVEASDGRRATGWPAANKFVD